MSNDEKLKKAAKIIRQLQQQLQIYSKENEPLAIVGMSATFPKANTLDHFWENLQAGFDGITEVPANRWSAQHYYDEDTEAAGKINTTFGGFLSEDISQFDAAFFGISPKEAIFMDPQQRLLLEHCWLAVQHAGIEPKSLKGSATGVYMGLCLHDYATLISKTLPEEQFNAYLATGNAASVAAGRIAYTMGLEGPTLTVDTACSSSLTALHVASQGLRTGEADLALVGGVNLILTPDNSINFTKAHMLAADGHCKTFDKKANGYVRGEGCGVLVLKRLADAKHDGNPILALVKGSAINQDGASSGLTVPNGSAQQAVIRQALQQAGLQPNDIDYIECHGTGTSLGDPIEIRAIAEVMHTRQRPLILGSVKTNIGHLEGAAGIAGVIKTVLALQHRCIPAHRNFTELNPLIELADIPGMIATENTEWLPQQWQDEQGNSCVAARRAGVSSFGFSGSNAHVILEESPNSSIYQATLQPLQPQQFQRQRYWLPTDAATQLQTVLAGEKSGYNLWTHFQLQSTGDCYLQADLTQPEADYLQQHCLFSTAIFPGAAYVDGLLTVIEVAHLDKQAIVSLSIESPCLLTGEQAASSLQLVMQTSQQGYKIIVSARQAEGWQRYVSAYVQPDAELLAIKSITTLQEECSLVEDFSLYYQQYQQLGLTYGPDFQTVQEVRKNSNSTRLLVTLKAHVPEYGYAVHPTLLDGALQALAMFLPTEQRHQLYLPVLFEGIRFNPEAGAVRYAYLEKQAGSNQQTLKAAITLLDSVGRVILTIECLHAQASSKRQWQHSLQTKKDSLLFPIWKAVAFPREQSAELFVEDRQHLLYRCLSNEPLKVATDLLALVQSEPQQLVVLTYGLFSGENIAAAAAMGFLKTVVLEHPQLDARLFDSEELLSIDKNIYLPLIQQALSLQEPFVAFDKGKIYVHRLHSSKQQQQLTLPAGPYQLLSSESHELAALHIDSLTRAEVLADDEIEIVVMATGLNFRDVLNAMGLYPGEAGPLGGEVAGRVVRVGASVQHLQSGDAVYGESLGGFCSHVLTKSCLVAKKPNFLSFADAAALPIVYLTAYQALHKLAKIQPGNKVLIHAAAGGVGLAAIQIAKHLGAEIYATASAAKQDYLRELGVLHVYDSRSTQFAEQIISELSGAGIDVVLNSLTSPGFIAASLSCLRTEGIFLEIGKRNIYSIEQMQAERADVNYHIIAIDALTNSQPEYVGELLQEINQWLHTGAIQALPINIYPLERAKTAYHYMSQGKHIGKLVLTQTAAIDSFIPGEQVLITGGLGALGFITAEVLAAAGAREIVLTTRAATTPAAKQAQLQQLQQQYPELQLSVMTLEVTEAKAVKKVLESLPRLTAIFHLAAAIEDGLLTEQNEARFATVFAAKVQGAINLHKALASLQMNAQLRYFVLYSSIAASMGSPGQSNYSAANACLDQLARKRRADNLVASSINWGPWASTGMAADLTAAHAKKGFIAFTVEQGKQALRQALQQSAVVLQQAELHSERLAAQGLKAAWLQDILGEGRKDGKLFTLLKQAQSAQREELLSSEISRLLQQILGLNEVSEEMKHTEFFQLGMDSLMAVELKNRLQSSLGTEYVMSNTLLFEHNSIADLTAYLSMELNKLFTGKQTPQKNKIDWSGDAYESCWLQQTQHDDPYLFLLPPLGFPTSIFQAWSDLGNNHLNVRVVVSTEMEAWQQYLQALASEISALSAGQPYILYGHSFGAITAYEVSKLLAKQQKKSAEKLIISSINSPDSIVDLNKRLNIKNNLSDNEILQQLYASGILPDEKMQIKTIAEDLIIKQYKLLLSYAQFVQQEQCVCPIHVVRACEDTVVIEKSSQLAWQNYSNQFSYEEVRGEHMHFINPKRSLLPVIISSTLLNKANQRGE